MSEVRVTNLTRPDMYSGQHCVPPLTGMSWHLCLPVEDGRLILKPSVGFRSAQDPLSSL
jgi:hypothetical protein